MCDLIHLNQIWKYFNMSRFRFRIFKTTLEFNKFKYYPLILEKRRATFWREGDIVFISETIILFQYRDNYFQKILSEKMIPYRISERGECVCVCVCVWGGGGGGGQRWQTLQLDLFHSVISFKPYYIKSLILVILLDFQV